jgi:very-short-patch-repair endonuclease
MQIIAGDQRVDFALEVPNLVKNGWLRIVVEIDDTSHQGRGQRELDAQRDGLLKK